jgi:hypothetical protein
MLLIQEPSPSELHTGTDLTIVHTPNLTGSAAGSISLNFSLDSLIAPDVDQVVVQLDLIILTQSKTSVPI